MRLVDLMQPEGTIGNLWHDMASGIGAETRFPSARVELASVRPSLAVLFRALGGSGGVEIGEAAATLVRHRQPLKRKLGAERDREYVARYDSEKLYFPPVINTFLDPRLNRAAYFWLTALAAKTEFATLDLAGAGPTHDYAQIYANAHAADAVFKSCPGLRADYAEMAAYCAKTRPDLHRPAQEASIEQAIRMQLGGDVLSFGKTASTTRSFMPFAPVPIWLRFEAPGQGGSAAPEAETEQSAPAPSASLSRRKLGERKDQDQHSRKDSFIIGRFESILSWVESMNINRNIDDDDDENAQKAADDEDRITLSKQDRKTATRLRLHLDLSPADADHEALEGEYTYPDWNHRSRSYMQDHCRVLEGPIQSEPPQYAPNDRYVHAVRRRFEALRPRRVLQPRQIDGQELDLDALLIARADLLATGRGADRIWQAAQQVDRSAIWGFSSLRRNRVFLTRCKGFEEKMGANVTNAIGAIKPGHYTRLGAAIRHISTQLAKEPSARKLLIVLTDGKPNDLDHYEGQHGIGDSHRAVREARTVGQGLHDVILTKTGRIGLRESLGAVISRFCQTPSACRGRCRKSTEHSHRRPDMRSLLFCVALLFASPAFAENFDRPIPQAQSAT